MDANITEAFPREKTLVNQSEEAENNSMHKNNLDREEVSHIENDHVDDRPVSKGVHQFYVVKFYEDQDLNERIEEAENLIKTLCADQFQINQDLERKRVKRNLKEIERGWSYRVECKKNELKYLQHALNRTCSAINARRGKRNGLCSPIEEDSIKEHNGIVEIQKSMNYRRLHESKSLAEEKKILKEIKQLEGKREKQFEATVMEQQLGGTREKKLTKNFATNTTNCWDFLGSRKAIREQIKLKEKELDGLREKHRKARDKIMSPKPESLEQINKDMLSLCKEQYRLSKKSREVIDYIIELRKKNEASC